MPNVQDTFSASNQNFDTIRDWRHATRIFVDSDYRLAPKYGFLFHVKFELADFSLVGKDEMLELGMMVKAVTLPKFTVENKTLNAYNRVNIVQTKIKYDSVELTFHDDQANVVNKFWRDYYSFYYRDADYADQNGDTYPAVYEESRKYQERQAKDWGYTLRGPDVRQYLKAIRIYSLGQGRFTEYVLINPTITSFQHGEHDTSQGTSILEHKMSVAFETVLFYPGDIKNSTVAGYIDLHYDQTPSPLTNPALENVAETGYRADATGIHPRSDIVQGPFGQLSRPTDYKSYVNNKNFNLINLQSIESNKSFLPAILKNVNPGSLVNVPSLGGLGQGVYRNSTDTNSWQKNNNLQLNNQGLTPSLTNLAGIINNPFNFSQPPKLNTNNTPPVNAIVSNGGDVALRQTNQDILNSPAFKMPLDTSSGTLAQVEQMPAAYFMRPMNNPESDFN